MGLKFKRWGLLLLTVTCLTPCYSHAEIEDGPCEAIVKRASAHIASASFHQNLRKLRSLILRNSFVISRDLDDYARELGFQFLDLLLSLPPDFRWLDSGAGRAYAQRTFFERTEVPLGTLFALGFRRPWWTPVYKGGRDKSIFYYIDSVDMNEPTDVLPFLNSSLDLITDVFGPFSYSTNPIKALRQYLKWLKPGGELRISIRGFSSSVTLLDGSHISFTSWLENQLAKNPHLEFQRHQGSWRIRKLKDQEFVIDDLVLTELFLSKPPTRYFGEAPKSKEPTLFR